MELDGNHVLTCPVCGHEHCRVVKGGKITEDRWDSRNQTYYVNPRNVSFTSTSTYTTYSSSSSATYSSSFLYTSWMNTTAV